MIEPEPANAKAPAYSIHLLDDDSDWLLFLFEYLSNAGHSVTASSTMEDSLNLMARSRPDLLIADQDVPGLNDIELLDRVRSLSPATRVILTTQRSTVLPSVRWLRSGGVDLLVKPIDRKTLMRAVERSLRIEQQQTQS